MSLNPTPFKKKLNWNAHVLYLFFIYSPLMTAIIFFICIQYNIIKKTCFFKNIQTPVYEMSPQTYNHKKLLAYVTQLTFSLFCL